MRTTMSSEAMNIIKTVTERGLRRRALHRPVTCSDLENAVREVLEHVDRRGYEHRNERSAPEPFEWTRAVRGLLAKQRTALVKDTAEADLEYVKKTLTTTAPSGQYLVPVIQADAIVAQLSAFSSLRAAGAKIWPTDELVENVPLSLTAPTAGWQPENSKWNSADPQLGQMNFTLKTCGSFLQLPSQLFKVSHPAMDVIFESAFAQAIGEAEDVAAHATSTVTNGTLALMSQAGILTLNAAGNNANGGSILYSDLTATIEKAVSGKVRPPYVWFLAGRTWLRLLNLISTTSQPLIVPGQPEGPLSVGTLFGFPVFAAQIPTNEAVGSGSNQSHLVFTRPGSLHVAESGEIGIDVSFHLGFDADTVAIRCWHRIALGYAPAGSIVALTGIN